MWLKNSHVRLLDIAQQEGWLDEVIAGVQVAVVLQGEGVATGVLEDAQAGLADPVSQGGIEGLHEDLAHISAHPLIEDRHKKTPVLLRPNRALGDQLTDLRVQRAVASRALAPTLVGHGQRLHSGSLDNGDELNILRP